MTNVNAILDLVKTSQVQNLSLVNQMPHVKQESVSTYLPQKNENQMNVREMAALLSNTNEISPKTRRKVNNLLTFMTIHLKNGVQDEDGAIASVIKDFATRKLDVATVEKAKNGIDVPVKGKNGRVYKVHVQLCGGFICIKVPAPQKPGTYYYESPLKISLENAKALPIVYEETH
ncbi:MAG: hypothetical protein MJ229_05420 [bacterium]|nr:hypothetical protein [bacterium]